MKYEIFAKISTNHLLAQVKHALALCNKEKKRFRKNVHIYMGLQRILLVFG